MVQLGFRRMEKRVKVETHQTNEYIYIYIYTHTHTLTSGTLRNRSPSREVKIASLKWTFIHESQAI